MSSQAGMASNSSQWLGSQPQGPPTTANNGDNDEGVSIRPMRLKVLYTFDDQNKTNCLARWPHVLEIQTVAMDESTSIGVIELKTCIQAIVQCSPELVARVGQDYTVYAYDYSEYDNPLVGQGMLSKAFAAVSPTPDAPAHQSRQLITGRVCKNILGLFTNGVKETLEVKLRLVPVPTALQNEYLNTMDKYREMSKVPTGFGNNEWASFLQSNPNIAQMANQPSPQPNPTPNQRDGMSMEVVNQLLSPSLQQQSMANPFNQPVNADMSGNESQSNLTAGGKVKKPASRPSSRASVKRPRGGRKPRTAAALGGNTSGYEEGTDGDDGPPLKKRAKTTKADWKSKTSLDATPDSLRVVASTAGSLRMFRPIAVKPNSSVPGGHLQEVPRAPTPVPILPNQHVHRDREPSQSGLRRDSFASVEPIQKQLSPYPQLEPPEDQIRYSIESANTSPERHQSPSDTPQNIGSSPPLMRTRPPSPTMRSSPPCPSSPELPQMPRTDSGFMSGSLEELFGEDEEMFMMNDEAGDISKQFEEFERRRASRPAPSPVPEVENFFIQEECPGPRELLPTKMPIIEPPHLVESKARAAMSRAGSNRDQSVMSDDSQTLPPLKKKIGRPSTRRPPVTKPHKEASQPPSQSQSQQQGPPQQRPTSPGSTSASKAGKAQKSSSAPPDSQQLPDAQQPQPQAAPAAPRSRPGSRMMVRTASMGSLTLPTIPASDPALPPSNLQRSQTWSEAPHPATEAPMPPEQETSRMSRRTQEPKEIVPSRTFNAKKALIRERLETAIANGEMPPFCSNCGAIETPTWRKAWSQDLLGEPGYHDLSDEPGCVTAIIILTRDTEGKPTSYQLIKKFLLPEENSDDYKEFILCNPCGIWMSKYKAQRPPARWENNALAERKTEVEEPPKKRPTQRKPKKSQDIDLFMPTSEANWPQSEANFPPSEMGPVEGESPTDTTSGMQQRGSQEPPAQSQRQRSTSAQPRKRLNAMTSDAASAALRRAIRSSPARWAGTLHSPIDVEEDQMGSTRRLLFPSPRKDGSPKVLGDLTTNVVQIATDFRSPKECMVEVDAPNKENCPPAIDADDVDAELLKLFEEELARPTTPVQKESLSTAFKTPTRPTPSHRPVTRSVSKSIRSGNTPKTPGQILLFTRTPTKTPGSGRRRSPRNHDSVFESPFTATINQLMSEANNHTSPVHNSMELDFNNLPDLPHVGHLGNVDMNFNLEDFFSTDVPMPSSPPRMFHLYEDPMASGSGMGSMNNINWEEFGQFDAKDLEGGDEVVVKQEPEGSPEKMSEENEAGKEQAA